MERSLLGPEPCQCGRDIPSWVTRRIAKLRWQSEPDEIIVCGNTMMYRHGSNWAYAVLSRNGRDACGMASYMTLESVEKASRAHA